MQNRYVVLAEGPYCGIGLQSKRNYRKVRAEQSDKCTTTARHGSPHGIQYRHHTLWDEKNRGVKSENCEMRMPGQWFLYSKTISASATPAGIGINKMKSFPVESVRKIKHRIAEVKKRFHIGDDFDAVVFKHLILGLNFIVEIQFIAQSGATAAYNTHS